MTIFNAWIDGDSILVATDSDAVAPDGSHCNIEKLLALPLTPAVIGGRGTAGFITTVGNALVHARLPDRSLRTIATAMPILLPGVRGNWAGIAAAHGQPGMALPPQTIIVAGYCDRSDGPVLHEYEMDGDRIGHATPRHHIAPWDRSIDHLASRPSVPGAIELARAQVALMRARAPGAAAGGYLVVARITRGSVSLGRVATLSG